MLLADRERLWPKLEKLGESKVRQMLAQNRFEAHEQDEVKEWLARSAAVSTTRDANITKIAAIIAAVTGVITAVGTLWTAISG